MIWVAHGKMPEINLVVLIKQYIQTLSSRFRDKHIIVLISILLFHISFGFSQSSRPLLTIFTEYDEPLEDVIARDANSHSVLGISDSEGHIRFESVNREVLLHRLGYEDQKIKVSKDMVIILISNKLEEVNIKSTKIDPRDLLINLLKKNRKGGDTSMIIEYTAESRYGMSDSLQERARYLFTTKNRDYNSKKWHRYKYCEVQYDTIPQFSSSQLDKVTSKELLGSRLSLSLNNDPASVKILSKNYIYNSTENFHLFSSDSGKIFSFKKLIDNHSINFIIQFDSLGYLQLIEEYGIGGNYKIYGLLNVFAYDKFIYGRISENLILKSVNSKEVFRKNEKIKYFYESSINYVGQVKKDCSAGVITMQPFRDERYINDKRNAKKVE